MRPPTQAPVTARDTRSHNEDEAARSSARLAPVAPTAESGLGAGPQETCCSEPGRPRPVLLPGTALCSPDLHPPDLCPTDLRPPHLRPPRLRPPHLSPLTCALCPSYLYSQVKAASSKRFRTSLTPRVGWANIGFRGTPGMGERVR